MSRFAVVMPAYNAEDCIRRAVDSVLAQTKEDFNLYIINDGSTDGTAKIIEEYNDVRIHLINKDNEGVSKARNTAILNSKSEYVCFLDSDDEWYPNHLYVLAEAIDKFPTQYFYVTTSITELKNGDFQTSKPVTLDEQVKYYEDYFAFEQKYGYIFNTNCVCVKREAFERYGMFAEGVAISEDIDLWYRIMLHTGVVVIPKETNLRHRDFSKATKYRHTDPTTIFWTRIPELIKDEEILDNVKRSLLVSYEQEKISEARCYILNGEKKTAYGIMKNINTSHVSLKRYIITWLSFLVPKSIILKIVNYRDRNYFDS